MSTEPAPAPKKKAADVQVLRCLDPGCRTMLAYEVTSENVLYVDLAWTARRDGALAYFPCPKCVGRNVVEEFHDAKGARKHRVTRFEPAPAAPADELELIPRAVRDKLDRIGVKLHLRDWQAMALDERLVLRDQACASDEDAVRYRAELERIVRAHTGHGLEALPAPPPAEDHA